MWFRPHPIDERRAVKKQLEGGVEVAGHSGVDEPSTDGMANVPVELHVRRVVKNTLRFGEARVVLDFGSHWVRCRLLGV
jgi:hypothetical protein